MQEAHAFYSEQLATFQKELSAVKQRSLLLAMLRLTVFIALGLTIYFFYQSNLILVMSLVLGIGLFLFLVNLSAKSSHRRKFLEHSIQINRLELDYLDGSLEGLVEGLEFIDPEHPFSADIDLFGPGSIFQHINRTPLDSARKKLAEFLNANEIDGIVDKQEAIRELSFLAEWRQEFEANSMLIESEVESKTVANWLQTYASFVPKIFKWLPIVWFVLSLAIIALYAFSLVGEMVILAQLIIGLAITGLYFKKISLLAEKISRVKDKLRQFSNSLWMIETANFESKILQEAQSRIEQEGSAASKILSDLTSEINSLDQRSNFLFAPIADGFALWELKYAFRIEQWIKKFEHTVEDWFEVIDEVHAFNAFANYAFNHQDYTFPDIQAENKVIIQSTALGHPTLSAAARVANDFTLNRNQFLIITGANMAGKSTFLRTMGVSIAMANVGLPVCAKTFKYSPIKLISSMRTTDSLDKNESYFFSELKRLQYVSNEIQKDSYLIILDEILKGTNSADKEEGSKKFVEKLVASNSTGIIATHDLSLCQLSGNYEAIENYFFDARIAEDDLIFDYKLKPGICENMNASFLLKKMNIV